MVTSAYPYLYKRVETIHIQEGMGASAVTSAYPCLYKRVLLFLVPREKGVALKYWRLPKYLYTRVLK